MGQTSGMSASAAGDTPLQQANLSASHAREHLQDVKKKMSPTNAKALNTMRQRLKKTAPVYSEAIAKFRENPESTEEEEVCLG